MIVTRHNRALREMHSIEEFRLAFCLKILEVLSDVSVGPDGGNAQGPRPNGVEVDASYLHICDYFRSCLCSLYPALANSRYPVSLHPQFQFFLPSRHTRSYTG